MLHLHSKVALLLALVTCTACGSEPNSEDTSTTAGPGTTTAGPGTTDAMNTTTDEPDPTSTTDTPTTTPLTSSTTSDGTTTDVEPDTTSSTTSADESSSSSGGIPDEPFSFFVTSLRAMQELSGSQDGFGGDLRFGEDGPGAGLRGADKICAAVAEESLPGSGAKGWRAFLSVNADEGGQPVNAIDRIGPGPWFDRLGRLVAMTPADLANERPQGADAAIVDDLPNEEGVPNHQPDPNMEKVDNHDTLTGSNKQGQLADQDATCDDWTTSVGQQGKRPVIGHSWPRSQDNGRHWISDHDAGGCGAGVNVMGMGGPQPGDFTVGAGGGYGGIYCFALIP